MAAKSGVDMEKLLLVLTHATGDCVAVRTRLPVPGVIPESPASNGWQPGFMTDLMAKDIDLAMAYAAAARRGRAHHGGGAPAADGGERRRLRPGGLLLRGQGASWRWPAPDDRPGAAAHPARSFWRRTTAPGRC